MNEGKVEASIAVQGRVSIVALAKIDRYLRSEGYEVRSMSQLIGWSVELLYDVLKVNKLVEGGEESVIEANRYLMSRKLYQRGMESRNRGKIATAIRFEGMRNEGYDPRELDGRSYNILHNEKSVKPMNGVLKSEVLERAVDVFNSISLDKIDHSLFSEPVVTREKTSEEDMEKSRRGEKISIKEKMSNRELEMKMKEIEENDREESKKMDEFLKGLKDGE